MRRLPGHDVVVDTAGSTLSSHIIHDGPCDGSNFLQPLLDNVGLVQNTSYTRAVYFEILKSDEAQRHIVRLEGSNETRNHSMLERCHTTQRPALEIVVGLEHMSLGIALNTAPLASLAAIQCHPPRGFIANRVSFGFRGIRHFTQILRPSMEIKHRKFQ